MAHIDIAVEGADTHPLAPYKRLVLLDARRTARIKDVRTGLSAETHAAIARLTALLNGVEPGVTSQDAPMLRLRRA